MALKIIHDPQLWAKHWADIPLVAPGGNTREQLETRPGNRVKGIQPGPQRLFGTLSIYDREADRVVVIAPMMCLATRYLDHMVWEGTISDYHKIWTVD